MKALNLEGITISFAQLVPRSLASASRKRRATEYVQKLFSWSLLLFHCSTTNTECGTNSNTTGDFLSIAFFIKYPTGCVGSPNCRKKFNETVELTIATLHNTLSLPIPITGGSILDVQLTFCSFNQFNSGKRCMQYFALPKEWHSDAFVMGLLVIKISKSYNLPLGKIFDVSFHDPWQIQ